MRLVRKERVLKRQIQANSRVRHGRLLGVTINTGERGGERMKESRKRERGEERGRILDL